MQTDRFANAENLYSIVVVGNMNPAIHQPRWYKDVGILDEHEVKEAEEPPSAEIGSSKDLHAESRPFLVSSYAAQFTTQALRIVCSPQNWSILAVDENNLDKCLMVASQVFKKLDSTPISAYGFNFQYHRQTSLASVNETLAELARKLPLGFTDLFGRPKSARISYSAALEGGQSNTSIEGSVRNPSWAFIAMNFDHQIRELQGFFELDSLLMQDFPRARELANRYLDSILSALNKR